MGRQKQAAAIKKRQRQQHVVDSNTAKTHNCSRVASGDREKTEAMKKKTEEVDEKIIKTTLRTPHSLWTVARITALKEGISVQELVTKAIRAYVKGGRS